MARHLNDRRPKASRKNEASHDNAAHEEKPKFPKIITDVTDRQGRRALVEVPGVSRVPGGVVVYNAEQERKVIAIKETPEAGRYSPGRETRRKS